MKLQGYHVRAKSALRPMQARPRPATADPLRDSSTVARFLVAGRPLPRVEETVKIGELLRLAALAQFGWRQDEATGRRRPRAPWQISGRGADGRPLKAPSHVHAFWLPEDADGDGWIDHISVYVAGGIDDGVRAKLDRITRLWFAERRRGDEDPDDASAAAPAVAREWRLALEGFGSPADFAGASPILGRSAVWCSATPFLASGHLKTAGYGGEVRRLLRRRGLPAENVEVVELECVTVGGAPRWAIEFDRFRSRSREAQPDAGGALLGIVFPEPVGGPLALGYGSHFGLGMFAAGEPSP